MGSLAGKVAVVTGATSGIGTRIARLFVGEGAQVVLAGRREAEGAQVAAELGDAATFRRADVSAEEDVRALVEYAAERHGRLDVMVSNAGGPGHWVDVADVDLAAFREVMDVHLYGVLLGMKYAARVMVPQGSGSIINMASVSGTEAGWSGLDYSAAKAAIIHLTRCAAIELGESGVRVNSIAPSVVLTGIFGKGAGLDPAVADRTADGLAGAFPLMMGDYQAVRRPVSTEDVAQAALWLAGDAAGIVNGVNLAVDGGVSAGRPVSVSRAERVRLATAWGSRG
ncbi:SDR family NAD(P)-dependent oxidoreductase [Winogradskya humida]|uniref:Oxidoreductase n=1 Tax=Winogradskya humida TaxID=113566 RepID=A0ABQ3ZWX7_9ACTN|nr:SDR family oxidoreductase [Actinoplanes humidus]GIE23115.1 oxidoreductase [Actinoplanes humidus]